MYLVLIDLKQILLSLYCYVKLLFNYISPACMEFLLFDLFYQIVPRSVVLYNFNTVPKYFWSNVWKKFHNVCDRRDYLIVEICTTDDVESIIDEANLMSEFNHPHVLRLVGVTIDKEFGLPILVMPFMPNGDLNSYLRRFRYDSDFIDKVILSSFLLNFCKSMSI